MLFFAELYEHLRNLSQDYSIVNAGKIFIRGRNHCGSHAIVKEEVGFRVVSIVTRHSQERSVASHKEVAAMTGNSKVIE